MSINLYTNKGLFKSNPAVGIMQFMFIRGLISTFLMTIWSYGSLKTTLIDSVDRSNLASLVFRCLQGAISLFITFLSIKFFNVSTVGIVCSLTPLFVCLFAYFLLGERLQTSEQFAMIGVFASVCMVILGAEGQDRETRASNPLAVIALVCQPILIASGVICMRQMRKMPETTASFYQNLTLAVFSAAWMTYERESFNFMNNFSVQTWLLVSLSSLLTILAQTTKATAFKFHSASALQKLAFVPNVW